MKEKEDFSILIGCEISGRVRDAFLDLGFTNTYSCDLLEDDNKNHYGGVDIRKVLKELTWDMLIAFPPCTYLCSSGLHWNNRIEGRIKKTEEAIEFVQYLIGLDIEHIAIENPIGCLSSIIGKPNQIIQPYQFGEDASKATCLWLKNLPNLTPTEYIEPRITPTGKKRWGNQTDSGQNKLTPSPTRAYDRSLTYPGIALAMASQWGDYLLLQNAS